MDNQSWGAPKIKGRGMIKWQTFASMPEQFAGICVMNHKFAEMASLWFFLFAAKIWVIDLKLYELIN